MKGLWSYGWVFPVVGIIIGLVEAKTIVDQGVTLIFVVLLLAWGIQWSRRNRAMVKLEKV